MKVFAYVAGLSGLALAIALLVHADVAALLQIWQIAGWMLLWLIPYRGLYFLLYALGWRGLLRPYVQGRGIDLKFLFWVTSIREAIDRLLPVASVGGGVAAVRLLRARGLPLAPVGATIIVEVALTLWTSYVFAAFGVLLAVDVGSPPTSLKIASLALLAALPVPAVFLLLLRRGAFFGRLAQYFSALLGVRLFAATAQSLERELRACSRDNWTLLWAGTLQFAALASVSYETWFALRLFGHPVSAEVAVILESATQAIRHAGFFVPGGLGIQEAGLVLVGQAFGINAELALAVSMAKRMRELGCGVPALLSWQWTEAWRIRPQSPLI